MKYVQSDLYDALGATVWEALTDQVTVHLHKVRDANVSGVAVDLGAGTGLSAAIVADALPAIEVLACEPDKGLRASLMTRCIMSPTLTERCTLYPYDHDGMLSNINEPVAVFTAFNMIGHLTEAQRHDVWAWLATHLVPGGVGLVGPIAAHNPTDDSYAAPVDASESVYARRQVGRRTYEGAAAYTPLGNDLAHPRRRHRR